MPAKPPVYDVKKQIALLREKQFVLITPRPRRKRQLRSVTSTGIFALADNLFLIQLLNGQIWARSMPDNGEDLHELASRICHNGRREIKLGSYTGKRIRERIALKYVVAPVSQTMSSVSS
jgi:hypothetical protein